MPTPSIASSLAHVKENLEDGFDARRSLASAPVLLDPDEVNGELEKETGSRVIDVRQMLAVAIHPDVRSMLLCVKTQREVVAHLGSGRKDRKINPAAVHAPAVLSSVTGEQETDDILPDTRVAEVKTIAVDRTLFVVRHETALALIARLAGNDELVRAYRDTANFCGAARDMSVMGPKPPKGEHDGRAPRWNMSEFIHAMQETIGYLIGELCTIMEIPRKETPSA